MKRVLFIAYYIPPAGGAGVQRSTKFIKHLPEFGWNPVILTVHPDYYQILDPSLNSEIASEIPIHRTSAYQLPAWIPWRVRNWVARWFLVVDEHLGWYPTAIRMGKQLLEKGDINAIYSTSPPPTDHLIAYALKRSTRLPWLIDLRDPWAGNFSRHMPTAFHRRLDARLEARAIRSADQVVVVSPTMREDLLARFPELAPERITMLANGFDKDDFAGVLPVSLPGDRFSIIYTGSFYRQERTPENFLRALAAALDEGRLPRSRIHVLFVGKFNRQVKEMIEGFGLADLVTLTGYLSHQKSIAYMLAANLLLLIIGGNPASKGILTGKLFEYLASGKPILALVPDGAAADLVHEARAGVVVQPDDIPAISDALVEMYSHWETGDINLAPHPEIIARYERRSLTEKLANLLEVISSSRTAA